MTSMQETRENLVEEHSNEEEDPSSELSIEDDFGLDSWAF